MFMKSHYPEWRANIRIRMSDSCEATCDDCVIPKNGDRGLFSVDFKRISTSSDSPVPTHPPFPSPHCPLPVVMSANGQANSALAPGHFLFTSESVGEGHPGNWPITRLPPLRLLNVSYHRQDL